MLLSRCSWCRWWGSWWCVGDEHVDVHVVDDVDDPDNC